MINFIHDNILAVTTVLGTVVCTAGIALWVVCHA